jgi:CBS domain-containing protein
MCTIREILMNKDRWVASIRPQASALEAATLMNRHKIGSLMVMDGETVVGILTERDLLQRVLVEQRDPSRT